jgi:hypothetical protein
VEPLLEIDGEGVVWHGDIVGGRPTAARQ